MKLIFRKSPNEISHHDVRESSHVIIWFDGIKPEYKAHRVDDRYAFISLNDSQCYANGTFATIGDLLLSVDSLPANESIQVFNSFSEFLSFLNETK